MATDEDYPIDLPILVTEAQICVAVKKFPFLPDKHIPTDEYSTTLNLLCTGCFFFFGFSQGAVN